MRHSSPNHNWNQDWYFYTLVSKPVQESAFSCQSDSRGQVSPAASDWSQVSRALSQIFSYLGKHAAAIESVQCTFVVISSLIVSLLTSSIVKILTTNREGSEIAARKYSYICQYWQCQPDSSQGELEYSWFAKTVTNSYTLFFLVANSKLAIPILFATEKSVNLE